MRYARGSSGQVYVHETPTANSAVLSGLVAGWTYHIQVWANGGPGTPRHGLSLRLRLAAATW